MRLSALFEEFCHFLRVEKGATPATIVTYRWCFGDFVAFVMKQVGGTVLLAHLPKKLVGAISTTLRGASSRAGQSASVLPRWGASASGWSAATSWFAIQSIG
jgi:hypothetical protein